MKKKLSEHKWLLNHDSGKEGLSYPNCDSNSKSGDKLTPLIELFKLSDGGKMELTLQDTVFLYNRHGELCLFTSRQRETLLTDNQLILLTPGEQIYVKAEKDSSFLLWKVNEVTIFYECMQKNKPSTSTMSDSKDGIILTPNLHIGNMFDQVISLLEDGFYCHEYAEGKLCELLILMRLFYDKDVLTSFFQPIQSIDFEFKKQVLLQYSNVRNVEELAAMVNLSRSGFHQYFKKVVGTSPSRWMNEEKARRILVELTTTNKTLKEIWMEYDFSSASYFNQFCWQHLGNAPSKLRKS